MIKKFKTLGQTGIKPEPAFYNEDGHFVFRSCTNQKEVFLHFNAAPSGAWNTAPHGHADALSFVLQIDGNPFFVDSGSYVYHTEYEWRKYFMGTLAHNTVKVNLNNQATIAGPNLWLSHYQTTILNTEVANDIMKVTAKHDGYKKQGVVHVREIIFEKSKNLVRINDTIECENPNFYFIELPFHLHPKTIVKQNNSINFQIADEKGHMLYLVIDKKLQTKIIKGQVEPQILGWYSDSFMQKEPCATIYCAAYIERTETFQTIILIK